MSGLVFSIDYESQVKPSLKSVEILEASVETDYVNYSLNVEILSDVPVQSARAALCPIGILKVCTLTLESARPPASSEDEAKRALRVLPPTGVPAAIPFPVRLKVEASGIRENPRLSVTYLLDRSGRVANATCWASPFRCKSERAQSSEVMRSVEF